MPLTRERIRHDLVRRTLRVLRTAPVTSHIVRVTLCDAGLDGTGLDGFSAPGPADHVKVFFPGGRAGEAAARDYTPAAFRPATDDRAAELDLDFVLHGDEGPASAWAAQAGPGDELVVAGPRGSHLAPAGVSRIVLVVDETAFPAAARWLLAAGDEVPVDVLAWPQSSEAERYFDGRLPAQASVSVFSPDELEDALRSVTVAAPVDDSVFFFLAGEATTLVPLRRHLRRELGLPADQVQASGYWKRGVAGLDHHAPVDPGDPD
jgi:NADPH-dependent ferric siderophore reductase